MAQRHCNKCKTVKPLTSFNKNISEVLGYMYTCRECGKVTRDAYGHSRNGLTAKIYSDQLSNSRRRNHPKPSYSLIDLRDFIFGSVYFEILYLRWINSGYEATLRPSVDRANDYKPYVLENLLRVCTWGENRKRLYSDKKNGINNKQGISVIQSTLDGRFIVEYYSQHEASRRTKVNVSKINAACKGSRKSAGGFKWRYAES